MDNESKLDGGNKSKKKKDLSAFVQSDLQDFKRQRQVRERSLTSPVTSVKEEPLSLVVHNVQQHPVLAFDGAQDQGPATLGSPVQPLPMPPTPIPVFKRKSPEKSSSSFTASPAHSGQVIEPQIAPSRDQIPAKNVDVVPRLVRSMTPQGPTPDSSSSLMPGKSSEIIVDMRPVIQTTYQMPNEPSSSSHCEEVRFLGLPFS